MKKVLEWIKKERIALSVALIIGLVCSTKVYSNNVQAGIANEVIRFHVLANSDSEEDQALKLKVRDGILKKYKKELSASKNLDDTREFLSNNIDGIISCAEEIIASEGYDYGVKAYITKANFPTRVYGDVSLPAGEYEAMRIEIGKAEGKNWWCVMFPPLCYVDVSCKEVPEEDKEILKNSLTDEEYRLITDDSVDVKVKFKLVEMWNSK